MLQCKPRSGIAPSYITEGPTVTEADKNRPFRMSTEGHASFKQHVRTCLRIQFLFVRRVGIRPEAWVEACNVIPSYQNNDGLRLRKSAIKNLANKR
jgi:hypothetical protein